MTIELFKYQTTEHIGAAAVPVHTRWTAGDLTTSSYIYEALKIETWFTLEDSVQAVHYL